MFRIHRTSSADQPRQRIYLSNLNQLIDRQATVRPESEVSTKLFPQRDFARKLAMSHQRIRSSIELRVRKFDLRGTSKKTKDMVIENNRSPEASRRRL